MSSHLRLRFIAVAVAIAGVVVPSGLAVGQGIGPVEAVNDAAVAIAEITLDVPAPGVLANDQVLASEPGAPSYEVCAAAPGYQGDYRSLAPRIVSQPGKGTLTISLDGSYRFVPATGFVGTVVFDYSLANIDELPQCPLGLTATLTIEVVAAARGSFDGTFTPVAVQSGPCILIDTPTIGFGDVPIGSTAWAAPTGGRTTSLSSCSPVDQAVNATVSPALGGGAGAGGVSLEPTDNPAPSVSQFSYGIAARSATAARPAAPGQVLTTVPSGVSTLQGGSAAVTIEHYLIGPAAGAPVSGTGFQFAVTLVATVRA